MVQLNGFQEINVVVRLWDIEDLYHLQSGLVNFIRLSMPENGELPVSSTDLVRVCDLLEQTLLGPEQLSRLHRAQLGISEEEKLKEKLENMERELGEYKRKDVEMNSWANWAKRQTESLEAENKTLKERVAGYEHKQTAHG